MNIAAFLHPVFLSDWSDAGQSGIYTNYTFPVQTAGGEKEYTLHVETSGGGKGYTLHVYTDAGGNVYTTEYISIQEMKRGQCIYPLKWSVHCNFTGDGKCNERGWACTPNPHQSRLILPSRLNVRRKADVTTLCTLWYTSSTSILLALERNTLWLKTFGGFSYENAYRD
jgi:hypothetical protein